MVRHQRPERAAIVLRWFWTARIGEALPGVDKSDQYRRLAQECLEMARTSETDQTRIVLIQMAQVWFRLAEARATDDAGHRPDEDGSPQAE